MEHFNLINQSFVTHHYLNLLQKRFGINACTTKKEEVLLYNKKVVVDWSNYTDKSTPIIADRLIVNDCKNIVKTSINMWGDDYYKNKPYVPISNTSLNSPVTSVVPIATVIPPIEVKVGTPKAIINGIVEDSLIISNPAFINKWVEIFRNNINVPSVDQEDGNSFFTKSLESSNIVLSTKLIIGEWIKIKVIA